jgi:dephospho-CoA kinase
LVEVRRLFGPDIVDNDGRLRRDVLARRVFADAELRKKLEAILHPRIRQLWRAQADGWRSAGHPLAAVAIPLLFETKAEAELDVVICLACTRSTQLQRLQARGWPQEQIAQRLQAQWSVEEKMAKAGYIIWTEASLEIHAAQLDRILRGL